MAVGNSVAARGPWALNGLLVVTGVALALGHAPFDFPWTWLVGFPLFIVTVRQAPSAGRAGMLGWMAGAGYFATSLSWIVEPFLVDVARHGWMAPFALILISAGLALFWGGGAYLARKFGRGLFALPLGVSLAEMARAHILTGFPWAHPAYVWTETPIAQAAAWLGPHGLALMVMVCLAPLAGKRVAPMIVGLAVLGSAWVFGLWLQSQPPLTRASAQVVRIVQPNAAQHLKWRPEMQPEFYRRLLHHTAATDPVSLVVWPETAVPFLLGERPDLQADISAAAGGAHVALGIRRFEPDEGWYNSLAILDPAGSVAASYDKHHLVPFGEFIPLQSTADRFGLGPLLSSLAGSFQSGPGPQVLSVPGLPAFQPLICYEAIFAHEVGKPERPGFLLQVTNDAWFGGFSGPYQHLAQARMRAIEQGLPMVRSANTGISAMIDARGRITAHIPLGKEGAIDVDLPEPLAPTFYARFGDWVWIWLVLAIGGLQIASPRRDW